MHTVDLAKLQSSWDELGSADPFWAILFVPDAKGNRWDVDAFFRSGQAEIAAAMSHLATLALPAERTRALDFGCGAGRLTQALSHHFARVDGVDIAPSMIRLANQHNPDATRCVFQVNDTNDLRPFDDDTFDLVYSTLVLQHIEPHYVLRYLEEFLRVLRPGGCAVFNLPSRPSYTWLGRVYAWTPQRVLNAYRRRRYGHAGVMELHSVRLERVRETLAAHGGTIVDLRSDALVGTAWVSYLYCVVKDPATGP
jgi:SAM-dependent methyltransferase